MSISKCKYLHIFYLYIRYLTGIMQLIALAWFQKGLAIETCNVMLERPVKYKKTDGHLVIFTAY